MKHTETTNVEKYFLYKKFIEECSRKRYPDNLVLHKHHKIPKCMGGGNDHNNLIKLSVEDHIKAHLLFAECFDINSKEYVSNMRSARILNNKSIKDKEILEKISKCFIGENNPFYGKKTFTKNNTRNYRKK